LIFSGKNVTLNLSKFHFYEFRSVLRYKKTPRDIEKI
jgi:hypothetical protein